MQGRVFIHRFDDSTLFQTLKHRSQGLIQAIDGHSFRDHHWIAGAASTVPFTIQVWHPKGSSSWNKVWKAGSGVLVIFAIIFGYGYVIFSGTNTSGFGILLWQGVGVTSHHSIAISVPSVATVTLSAPPVTITITATPQLDTDIGSTITGTSYLPLGTLRGDATILPSLRHHTPNSNAATQMTKITPTCGVMSPFHTVLQTPLSSDFSVPMPVVFSAQKLTKDGDDCKVHSLNLIVHTAISTQFLGNGPPSYLTEIVLDVKRNVLEAFCAHLYTHTLSPLALNEAIEVLWLANNLGATHVCNPVILLFKSCILPAECFDLDLKPSAKSHSRFLLSCEVAVYRGNLAAHLARYKDILEQIDPRTLPEIRACSRCEVAIYRGNLAAHLARYKDILEQIDPRTLPEIRVKSRYEVLKLVCDAMYNDFNPHSFEKLEFRTPMECYEFAWELDAVTICAVIFPHVSIQLTHQRGIEIYERGLFKNDTAMYCVGKDFRAAYLGGPASEPVTLPLTSMSPFDICSRQIVVGISELVCNSTWEADTYACAKTIALYMIILLASRYNMLAKDSDIIPLLMTPISPLFEVCNCERCQHSLNDLHNGLDGLLKQLATVN
ncbi:hypothetical protein M422DRAFT_265198 [Sphaerobolus stellatus SS14]|uniref:BTB domain-containing protein n=1 Tax=Sphaerobolus stellatus (strain SS14) TaxID=990650 RepID=A0A0C9V660_SPHS4|nr:hypothetical protein M422DRAFT_265198 [Sphaerobolus stellatus SS14]